MVISKIEDIKRMKFQIEVIDEQIEKIRSRMQIQAAKYSSLPKLFGYKQNVLQIQMEKLLELEKRRNDLEGKINEILEEFSRLPEMSYKVLYYRYFGNLTWLEISGKLGYSVAQCRRFYNVGLKI